MSETAHITRSIDLADRITAKAEAAVARLSYEIASWPAEFQEVMWTAVAAVANRNAHEAAERKAKEGTAR